ncbi:MAG: sialate O-acetylesterase, partial [Pirellulales bacterium]
VRFILLLVTFACLALPLVAEVPNPLPDPGNQPPAKDKPVKVYILSGQSNMVGIGQIDAGGSRWGKEFLDPAPVLSIYQGKYDSQVDYDTLDATKTMKLEAFGGVSPTPYPGGGVQIVRGHVTPKETGVYEFRPGYGDSTHNIMEVDGVEVYRKEVGGKPAHKHIKLYADKRVPFKITYLTDGANGLGWWVRMDVPGTLNTVVKQDGKFPYLVDEDGNWTVRNDVWYKGLVTATGDGPLTPGVQGNTIGPEMGFGHVLGTYHDEPVLIIKTSQGNRSLGWDFLPPGSERFEHEGYIYAGYKDSPARWEKGTEPKPINWYAGKQYDDCFGAAHEVLDNFDTLFPQYKDQGYEIAGFGWWQGHKDGGEPHASRYEQNLVHLIKTLRKEFKAPDAPFVIATIGFDGWEMQGPQLTVAEAQLAVSGDKGKYPEFKGNVQTVETRDFWPKVEDSPRNQGFHYHGNAETYMKVGEAMGRGMVKLQSQE